MKEVPLLKIWPKQNIIKIRPIAMSYKSRVSQIINL